MFSHKNFAPFALRACATLATLALLQIPVSAPAAYTGNVSGNTATMTGNSASDSLNIYVEGGLLKHNRFINGDPGFASSTDFNSSVAGTQAISVGASTNIVVNGGTGNDELTVDDDENTENTNYTFGATAIVGRFTVTYSNLDVINVYAGTDVDYNQVTGTALNTTNHFFCYNTGPVIVENADTLDDMKSDITIECNYFVRISDSAKVGTQNYTIEANQGCCTWVSRTNGAKIKLAGLTDVTLVGPNAGSIFNVKGLNHPLEIQGSDGADTLNISDNGSIEYLSSLITFYAGGGTDSVVVNNSANNVPEDYTIKGQQLARGSYETVSWVLAENIFLFTGTGPDNISVGLGTPDYIKTLNINSGPAGSGDILELLCSASTETVTIAPGSVTGTVNGANLFPVTHSGIDNLYVKGLDGPDTFTAQGSAGTEIFLSGDGPSGLDTVSLISNASAYFLTGNTFTVQGLQPIHFTGFEQVLTQAQPNGPDLIGYWGLPLVKCKTGKNGLACSIKATLLQLNVGNQPSAAGATQFFLSSDNTLDGNDLALTPRSTKALAPGGYAATKLSAKLPAGTDPAGKYLIGKLDANANSVETWETNNTTIVGPLGP